MLTKVQDYLSIGLVWVVKAVCWTAMGFVFAFVLFGALSLAGPVGDWGLRMTWLALTFVARMGG